MTDSSQQEGARLAWQLFVELRQELREAQKIRAQMIGFKIAFVTAALGFVFASRGGPPNYDLLLVPSFAAVFFDYLIVSYGYSIKRIGYYCRTYLEPKFRPVSWPTDDPLWEQAMSLRQMRQHYATAGNFGLTALVAIPAIGWLLASSWGTLKAWIAAPLALGLGLDLVFTYWRYAPGGRLPWPPAGRGPAIKDAEPPDQLPGSDA